MSRIKEYARSGPLWLAILGLGQLAIWGAIAGLSRVFALGEPAAERPIAAVLGLIVAAFGLYAASWFIASRTINRGAALGVVFVIALIARGVLIPTAPILEIDIYRYVWDGRVAAEGVSPYRFAPDQIKNAVAPTGDDRLDTLVALKDRTPELGTILGRIHYAPIATVYPPVSQAVFAAAAYTTPEGWPVPWQVAAMKAWLVLFDAATIAAVAALCVAAGRSPAECVAYAWCPLVLKETANSGHLDAIAVAFAAWAAVFSVDLLSVNSSPSRKAKGRTAPADTDDDRSTASSSPEPPATDPGRASLRVTARAPGSGGWLSLLLSATLLAFGVGAKLYPAVLLPVFAAVWWRAKGGPGLLAGGATAAAVSLATLAPMLVPLFADKAEKVEEVPAEPPAAAPAFFGEPAEFDAAPAEPAVPEQGLAAFLSRWEMNDLAFTFVRDQLTVSERYAAHHRPWAVVTPRAFRERASDGLAELTGRNASQAAFFATRAATLALCGLIALAAAAWVALRPTPDVTLRALFLTVAWFVLLAPTVNPWYWAWALPFLPFARGRVWGVVSLAAMTYYVRLWLVEHGRGKTLADLLGYAPGEAPWWADHAYQGSQIFDHLVVWLEWGPVFALLLAEWLFRDGPRLARLFWSPPPLPDAEDTP